MWANTRVLFLPTHCTPKSYSGRSLWPTCVEPVWSLAQESVHLPPSTMQGSSVLQWLPYIDIQVQRIQTCAWLYLALWKTIDATQPSSPSRTFQYVICKSLLFKKAHVHVVLLSHINQILRVYAILEPRQVMNQHHAWGRAWGQG